MGYSLKQIGMYALVGGGIPLSVGVFLPLSFKMVTDKIYQIAEEEEENAIRKKQFLEKRWENPWNQLDDTKETVEVFELKKDFEKQKPDVDKYFKSNISGKSLDTLLKEYEFSYKLTDDCRDLYTSANYNPLCNKVCEQLGNVNQRAVPSKVTGALMLVHTSASLCREKCITYFFELMQDCRKTYYSASR